MPEIFRIYEIVYNLPLNVQDRLDRDRIVSIDELIKELKNINDVYVIKQKIEEKGRIETTKKNLGKPVDPEKKPCAICASLGFTNRYHPIQLCRNKNLPKKEIYLTEQVEENENESYNIEEEKK